MPGTFLVVLIQENRLNCLAFLEETSAQTIWLENENRRYF